MYKLVLLSALALVALVVLTGAQNEEHKRFCGQHHGDCGDCLKAENTTLDQGGRCYYCRKTSNGSSNRCLALGFSNIQLTPECPNLNYNVGVCQVTAVVWIVLIVIVVIIFFVCCCTVCCLCCCWCHRRRQRQRELEDEQYFQEKDAIRKKSQDRKAERKAKNDEIRKKYGLNEDTAGTYKRLD